METRKLAGLGAVGLMLGGCYFNVNVYEHGDGDDAYSEIASQEPEAIEPPTLHRDGRLIFSAQPDEETLRSVVDGGAATVVNFRRDSEMEGLPFDEADVVTDSGANYIHIPLGGSVGEEPGYDPEDVDRLAEVLKSTEGDVYMHCASGGRARTIWTAYLVKYEGLTEAEATERAQKAGQEPSSLDRLLGKPSAYTPTEKEG